MFIVLLSLPDSALDKKAIYASSTQELMSSMYTFRFLFMMIFTVAASGIVIKVIKSAKVNYMFIFEFDPEYKVTHVQLFRVSNSPFLNYIDSHNAIRSLGFLLNVPDFCFENGVSFRKSGCWLHFRCPISFYILLY